MAKSNLKITETHSYLRLTTPNSTFTYGYNGVKASGYLVSCKESFNKLLHYMDNEDLNLSNGEKFKKLTNSDFLRTLFPEFDKDLTSNLTIGVKVKLNIEKHHLIYGEGEILKLNKKNTEVKFQKGIVKVDLILLEKI